MDDQQAVRFDQGDNLQFDASIVRPDVDPLLVERSGRGNHGRGCVDDYVQCVSFADPVLARCAGEADLHPDNYAPQKPAGQSLALGHRGAARFR